LKPANVMLDRSGCVKLIDFGIARTEDAADTQVGVLQGTPEYIAPERILGGPATPQVDVYAYGVLLFELFSGRRPFSGNTYEVLRSAVDEPLPIAALRRSAPRTIVSLVAAATAKDPKRRPQHFDAVVASLQQPLLRAFATKIAVIAAAVIVIALIGIAMLRRGGSPAPTNGEPAIANALPGVSADSIAVLPFDVVGGNSDAQYVADGLAESLTNTLARIRAVRVIASATAFTFRGRTDMQTIGRTLDVRTVVTGRLAPARNTFRLQVELVDVASGTQLWGQQYQGSEEDLLQFHNDLALGVSQQLRGDDSRVPPRPPFTRSPQAFQLYLKGRHALAQGNVPDIQRAIGFFDAALAVDPSYALAYSGIADGFLSLSGMFLPPTHAMAKAEAAAERALELDPDLAEAHVSLGIVRGYYDFDWPASSDLFKRAIALQPANASAHLWYAWDLLLTDHPTEALVEAQRAQELDPLSSFIEIGAAQMHYYSGQPEEAIRRLERPVQSRPDFFNGRYYLGVAYLRVQRYADAIRELERASQLDTQQPQPLGYLAYAYARYGESAMAQRTVGRLQRLAASRYVSDYVFAIAAAGMGLRDEAVRRLERAYEQHDDMLSVLGVDQPFSEWRDDPRIVRLRSRLGIA
jgi:serine/threonine-protein kinase